MVIKIRKCLIVIIFLVFISIALAEVQTEPSNPTFAINCVNWTYSEIDNTGFASGKCDAVSRVADGSKSFKFKEKDGRNNKPPTAETDYMRITSELFTTPSSLEYTNVSVYVKSQLISGSYTGTGWKKRINFLNSTDDVIDVCYEDSSFMTSFHDWTQINCSPSLSSSTNYKIQIEIEFVNNIKENVFEINWWVDDVYINFTICTDYQPPLIENTSINPSSLGIYETVTITADVYDSCNLDYVQAIIRGPISITKNMSLQTGNTYQTTYVPIESGIYSVNISAKDLSAPENENNIFIGNFTVKVVCAGFYNIISSIGLASEPYILDKEKVKEFVNSSIDPDCDCSKDFLKLQEYNYTFSINYTNGSLFYLNSIPLLKLCPSTPAPTAEIIKKKRLTILNNSGLLERVFVYLSVWKIS